MSTDKHSTNAQELADIVLAYIHSWELQWTDGMAYSKKELQAITAKLFSIVNSRYKKTKTLSFTRNELRQVIDSSLATTKSDARKRNPQSSLNPVCVSYIRFTLKALGYTSDCTPQEINRAIALLYLAVFARYQASGLTKLSLSEAEAQSAQEFIIHARRMESRNAREDARDRKIRKLRSRHGSVAEPCIIVHS